MLTKTAIVRRKTKLVSRTKHKAKVFLDSGSKGCDCGNFILSKGMARWGIENREIGREWIGKLGLSSE